MTNIPPGITARAFVRALLKDGFTLVRTRGSHRIFRHQDGRRVIVAYHSLNETFPIGTLKGMVADAEWTEYDFERLGVKKI